MAFLLTRELEFKGSAQLVKALPAIYGVAKMWGEMAPNMPFQISRSVSGHPLRIRWITQANSIDHFQTLFTQLQQSSEYLKYAELIAECANIATLRDEFWQTMN
jgi:hypothetical protein